MGQTQGKDRSRKYGYDAQHKQAQGGQPQQLFSPVTGSPLTYSPQMPMEPLANRDYAAVDSPSGISQSEVVGMAWPAQPKLVPTVLHWGFGGNHVEVEGSWDNWTSRTVLQHSGKDFTIIKLLAPGVYQYKYIVEGQWRYAPNLPAMYDDMGNINNVLEVQEFIPENLENLTGFEPPPSPPDSYCLKGAISADDYAKDAPGLPPHLNLTLLNVPPAMDASASLPRPQHVVLSHLFAQKGSNAKVMVLGATIRYKSKYVTTVIYKPAQTQTRWGSAMSDVVRQSMDGQLDGLPGTPGGLHRPSGNPMGTPPAMPSIGERAAPAPQPLILPGLPPGPPPPGQHQGAPGGAGGGAIPYIGR